VIGDAEGVAGENVGGVAMATMGIKVTPEQLQQVSSQLTAGASSIEGTLAQLASNVAPLGTDWAGLAQARFQELWAQWQRNAKGLNQALTGISTLMSQASANYSSTEQGIASSFGSA
jgi:early secretory antigenic target protein ESAT-6